MKNQTSSRMKLYEMEINSKDTKNGFSFMPH